MTDDDREFYRWPASIPCRCCTEQGVWAGQIVNLSYDGASIDFSGDPPSEGSEVEVVVLLEHTFRARVLYRERDGEKSRAGVQFYGSEDERRERMLPVYQMYIKKEESGE